MGFTVGDVTDARIEESIGDRQPPVEERAGAVERSTAPGGKLITDARVGRRVHVVLNMAASLDGRVAGPGGDPVQLSGPEDHERVHRLRAASDAIVVGIDTVISDDPRLTARTEPRPAREEQPLRVVVDSRLRIPPKARVLDGKADTLVLTTEQGDSRADADELAGAEMHAAGGGDTVDLAAGFAALEQRGIEQVLIEGGPTLAASALAAGLVDRLHLYLAPRVLGEGPSLADAWRGLEVDLEPRSRAPLGEGTLVSYGVQA